MAGRRKKANLFLSKIIGTLNRFVHIVCLDAPAPPDYGGAIDMYYKIVALAEAGYEVLLHYFDYKNRDISAIKKYCAALYPYQRKTGVAGLSLSLPYIVSSRINKELILRLNKDEYPVILEGIHCTGIIPFLKRQKKIIVRVHNNEAAYYKGLSRTEKIFWKKQYFIRESKKLHQYQQKLPLSAYYACLSENDTATFKQTYHLKNVSFVPAFIPWQKVECKIGKGAYCLYHGNIWVSENSAAVAWLITHIFSKVQLSFIIAGEGAYINFRNLTTKYNHISIVEAPDENELNALIQNAQINILPSFNETGVKLKLLHALFQGRYCITNTAGVSGSGINSGVHIANSETDTTALVQKLFDQPFTENDIYQRQELLQEYNNKINIQKLTACLYSYYP